MEHIMTFTIRDLLGMSLNSHDSAQRTEGKRKAHTDERNIVRPTAEEQRVVASNAASERMARARAAKAAKRTVAPQAPPPVAPPVKQAKGKTVASGPDAIQVPENASARKVFLTLLLLAQEQVADGTSPVVPHWRILNETKGEDLETTPRFILQDLERDGLVRQIVTRKGTLCWIPTVLDNSEGKGARGSKGGRSSDIRRGVEALEARLTNNGR
jgi:phosphatidylserine/phosphatidylglycerophosphate/cardiolipin synthase-like enzyme